MPPSEISAEAAAQPMPDVMAMAHDIPTWNRTVYFAMSNANRTIQGQKVMKR